MEQSFTPSEGRKGIAPISDEQLKSIVDTCEVATRTPADAAAASALARQAKVCLSLHLSCFSILFHVFSWAGIVFAVLFV